MCNKDIAWVKERLRDIKCHAIEQTEFYKAYKVTDEFPVVNKMTLIENHDACLAKAGYQTPTHVSSTSGSTGTPFSVTQDFRKRNRTIADLKVFGELCDYPSHERMVFFRVINAKLHRTPEQEDRENIYYIDSSDFWIIIHGQNIFMRNVDLLMRDESVKQNTKMENLLIC